MSDESDKEIENEGGNSNWIIRGLVWIGLIAFVGFTYLLYMLTHGLEYLEPSIAGSLGDFFGGMLNPIVALLGIILLALTLRQNSEALKLTRVELQKSSEQAKLSAIALNKQEQHMRQESIERTILFICGEIEREYQRDYEKEFHESGGFAIRKVNIQKISEDACKASFRSTERAEKLLDQLYEGVERVVSLLFILEMTVSRLENNVKDSMLTIIACKLNDSVVVAMYVEVFYAHYNYSFEKDAKLNDVLVLLDEISLKGRNPIGKHPLNLMYLEK
jgi:uncharacterized membrane protein